MTLNVTPLRGRLTVGIKWSRGHFHIYLLLIDIDISYRVRVICHKLGCHRSAVIKCIYHYDRGDPRYRIANQPPRGHDYARDPLCRQHGEPLGPCSDMIEHLEHVLIPEDQLYDYISEN